MNACRIDKTTIIHLNGGLISDEFVQLYKNGSIGTINAEVFMRYEHPHCAFFKTPHQSQDTETVRTTLYTPEGRLYIDHEKKQSGAHVQLDRFVKKEEHLDILLFYLRDIDIKSAFYEPKAQVQAIIMPKTPIYELLYYMQSDVFYDAITKYEMVLKHILSRLRKIYNAKIDILQNSIAGKYEYAVFENIIDLELDAQLLERWHDYYMRKVRLLKVTQGPHPDSL